MHEYLAPLDHELSWIITESATLFHESLNGAPTYHVYSLLKSIAPVVASTIHERHSNITNSATKLTDTEATQTAWNAYSRDKALDAVPVKGMIEIALYYMPFVVAHALIRINNPVYPVSDGIFVWPSDGGFCNPMKIKLMDDE